MLHHISLRRAPLLGGQRSSRHVARGVGQGFQPLASRPLAQYETHEIIARIDRGPICVAKIPAKRHIPTRSISGRHLSWRSVTVHWRSIPRDSTARTKYLEILTFMAVRSMQAVLCDAY